MTAALLAALLLAGQPPAADSALPTLPPGEIAFAAHCRYRNGTRALLAYRFGSDAYRLVMERRGAEPRIITVTPRADAPTNIDAGGGTIDQLLAVARLFDWLLRRDFRVFTEDGLAAEMGREDVQPCPEPDPFGR